MNAAEASAILGVVGAVAGLAEKYGPEVYETVKQAIEQSKSKTGPSVADIQAIFAKCKADNAAIQEA
ncbi:hypothetical protein S101468_01347 [Acetobacter pasteurianus subsp. pasteurianus]|uniref:Uncharacterized protein n=1 Tax=Acetobacter pasteurianus subsp. pasteurianus TaxID=481145 RepID=A0AAC9X173_ACEPA|nr:hypothetical protein [Acetobacter pasteurianus]ASC05605.1 hypothetical protein S101468_01347 [Acetobacter pasteurianus subsp. pasteurianus]